MFCPRCGNELPEGAYFCPACGAPAQPGAPASPSAPPMSGIDALMKDQRAQEHWIRRLVAIVVDYVIVYVTLGVITALVALPALFTGNLAFFAAVFGGLTVVWGAVFVLYFTVAESIFGASIGKRLFTLKVVSKTKTRPNFAEAFIRNISKIYWLLLLLDVIVGLAVAKGYQQKYSDHLMGTTVDHA